MAKRKTILGIPKCGQPTSCAPSAPLGCSALRLGGMQSLRIEKGCTPCGEYKCQVPMPISGRRQDIDICIADIVAALNAANIVTVASCCGHGYQNGVISLCDGRELHVILPMNDEQNPECTGQEPHNAP